MINFARFTLLILVAAFSSMFLGSLIYSVRTATDGGSLFLDIPVFLNSLLWSAGFIFIAILLAASPLGDRIAALFFPIRKMSLREAEKVNPAMARLRDVYLQKYEREIKERVFVMDVPHINGMALGRQTVAVSTGLLKVANDEEIAAILAHEIGHLHHKDGLFNMALIAASFPTIFLTRLLLHFVIEDSEEGKINLAFIVFFFFVTLLFCSYFTFFWLVSFPVLWFMRSVEFFTEWPIEYRADRFTLEMGFGPAMVALFERIEDEDIRGETGFLSKYLYSHPPTALRIDQIERSMIKESNS